MDRVRLVTAQVVEAVEFHVQQEVVATGAIREQRAAEPQDLDPRDDAWPFGDVRADFIGLLGGCAASVFTLRLDAVSFWRRAIDALDFADLMQGFTKPLVFGFILATIGCYKGLTVRGGTQGVGRATTSAAVVSSVLIIVADTFMTKLSLYLSDKIF